MTQPKPTGASEPRFAPEATQASIELTWLPLGAGGWLVRLNGRIYEAIHALLERRRPLDLYHSALIVRVPEGRFVIEDCWPIPDADGPSRGVAVEGPVFSRRMARFRVFRYEVRRWRDGVIADADEAVASPQLLSDDPCWRVACWTWLAACPARSGAGTSWGRARCGTRLGDRVATHAKRPPNRRDPSPGRWTRARMAGGPGHGLPQQRSDERAGHGAGGATARVGGGESSSELSATTGSAKSAALLEATVARAVRTR